MSVLASDARLMFRCCPVAGGPVSTSRPADQTPVPVMTGSAPASAGSMHDASGSTPPASAPLSAVGGSGSGASQPTAPSSDQAVVLAEHTATLPDGKPAGNTVAAAGRNIMELQAQVRDGS